MLFGSGVVGVHDRVRVGVRVCTRVRASVKDGAGFSFRIFRIRVGFRIGVAVRVWTRGSGSRSYLAPLTQIHYKQRCPLPKLTLHRAAKQAAMRVRANTDLRHTHMHTHTHTHTHTDRQTHTHTHTDRQTDTNTHTVNRQPLHNHE